MSAKLKYKGYIISQANNNHIMITKDNKMVFHASASKKLTKGELKEQIDWFINIFQKDILKEFLDEC